MDSRPPKSRIDETGTDIQRSARRHPKAMMIRMKSKRSIPPLYQKVQDLQMANRQKVQIRLKRPIQGRLCFCDCASKAGHTNCGASSECERRAH